MNSNFNAKEKIDLSSIDLTKIPITTNTFKWSFSASVIYMILNILSLLMPTVMILNFYSAALNYVFFSWRFLLIIFDIFAWWGLYLLITLTLGKAFIIILELIHEPKEGLFEGTQPSACILPADNAGSFL